MAIAKKSILLCLFFVILGEWAHAQFSSEKELQAIAQKVQDLTPFLKERSVAIRVKVGNRYGFGSGAIISSGGLILTCAHVSEISHDLTVVTASGKEYKATRLGANSINDYSLLRIQAANLPFFQLGDSKDLKMLQWVLALGHPGGPYPDHQPTFSIGQVRGLHKKLPIQLGEKFYDDAIQTDIPIFAGNSGGPLVDLDGKLIGINGAILLINELAFAVPIDEIKQDMERMTNGKNVQGRSPSGIMEIFQILMEMQQDVSPDDMYKMFENTPLGKILKMFGGEIPAEMKAPPQSGLSFEDREGSVRVRDVSPNTIGEMAGFRADDVVLSLDGQEVSSSLSIQEKLEKDAQKSRFLFRIKREDQEMEVHFILDKKAYSREHTLKRAFVYQGLDLMESTVKINVGEKRLGYGAIVSPEGWVLTANHILFNRPSVFVQLQSGKKTNYPARIVATHGTLDIALLQFDPDVPIKAISLGDEKKLKIGEWVISGGNEQGAIGIGMIGALKREVPVNRRIPTLGLFGLLGSPNKSPVRAYDEVVQHDTRLEAGDFGTPLVNGQGECVGINVGHFFPSASFAVPITPIREALEEMKSGKSVPISARYRSYTPEIDPLSRMFKYFLAPDERNPENLGEILKDLFGNPKKGRGFLGVKIEEDARGIRVVEAMKGHAAERAGIKRNDIILKIDKQKMDSLVILLETVQKMSPGTKVEVTVLRKEANFEIEKTFWVILDKSPSLK